MLHSCTDRGQAVCIRGKSLLLGSCRTDESHITLAFGAIYY